MCDWRNAFPECRRLSVLDALEKAVTDYFSMQFGIPKEEIESEVRGSHVVCANSAGECFLGLEGKGEVSIFPLGLGIIVAETEEELVLALEQIIRGAQLASVASYVCADGELGAPLKWRGWRSCEADRAFMFFSGEAVARFSWEKGADLGGVAGVADAPLAACMRIFYPPDSAPGILGIPRA